MIGGRSLVDEVNHVKNVVSLLYYYYVGHAYFPLHDDAVIMLYKCLIGGRTTKILFCRLP